MRYPLHAVPVSLAALLALAPARAFAQGAQDTTHAQPPQVSPIVVTATRTPVPAVTAAATVLSGAALRASGITHVLDALRQVPGVTILQSGSFGGQTSLYLRGGQSGYARVLVDGVPVNDPGGDFDFANLSTENVDRIEIVRGPASVLYGSDAVTGVIQIFTRRGSGPARVTLDARGGTYGTADADVALQGATRNASYSLSLAQYQTDGIYAFNNHYRHATAGGLFTLAPDAATDVRLSLHYADDNAHIPTDATGLPADHNAFQFGQRFTAGLDLARQLSSRVSAHLQLASRVSDGGFDDAQDDAADTIGFYGYQSHDHLTRRSADGRLDVALAPGVVASAGGVVEHEGETSTSASQSQFGPSDGTFDAERGNRAGYAQVVGARGRLAWNVSGRVDRNDAFGTFGTYRAGLAVLLPTETRVRGAIGTAFREPTFFQNYATGFVQGNPALHPEHTRSWELGAEQRAGDRVRLSGTWFQQRFVDLIDYTYLTAAPTDPNYFNIAAAHADGVELELDVHATAALALSGSYTHLTTQVVAAGYDSSGTGLFAPGSKLARRPEHSAFATASYQAGQIGGVQVRVARVGAREDVNYAAGQRVTLPAYTVVDVSGEATVLRGREGRTLTLTARVANALDETYAQVLGFRSPGRQVLAGLSTTF